MYMYIYMYMNIHDMKYTELRFICSFISEMEDNKRNTSLIFY